ncbi:hypothetical protein Neosp_012177 [[Neocosmospora] mangrovei]
MPQSTFCDSCEEILTWVATGVFRPNDIFYGQLSPKWISTVPKDGFDAECPLCAMFEYLLDRESYTRLAPGSPFWATKDPALDADLLRLEAADESISRRSICIKKGIYQNSECNAFQYNLEQDIVSLPESRSTWSLASLNKVISWLSACKNSHSDCNINTNSGLRLPKRLVDVDPDGLIFAPPTSEAEFERLSLENMPKVRICETSSLMNSPQYLTLSHRWDPNPTILLTSDNLVQFYEEIPISSLNQPGSKTIRDAIYVTRCLGFRYLWVDAICINQRERDDHGRDTTEELLAELEIMDQIYANGTCNISATSAKSAADGLFFDPLGLRLVEALKRRREQPTTPYRLAITFHGDLVDFLDSSPLNSRGWVFQERMLSPRVIHFTNLQIYWECFVTQSSEYHEQCFHSKPWSNRNMGRKPDLAISAKKPSSTGRKQRDPDVPRWNLLTHKFSKLSLSHPQDRLPAISALARHFQGRRELVPKDYVAGHWMPDLLFTLPWRVDVPRGRQDTLYLAPSWSWASVGCQIEGPTKELLLDEFAEILDVSVVSEDNDPFGKIKSGSMRLQCHISQAVLKVDDGDVKLGVLAGGKLLTTKHRLHAYLDFGALDDYQTEIRGTVPLPDNSRVQFLGDRVSLALLSRSKGHFPGLTKDDYTGVWKADWADLTPELLAGEPTGDYAGLILYPTGKEGQFVRVGSFLLKPDYRRKEGTSPISNKEDEGNLPEKRGKIRSSNLFGKDFGLRYEFDSDDDELFYGMGVEEALIARALLGRYQDGNQGPTGSLDATGRQVIEIV